MGAPMARADAETTAAAAVAAAAAATAGGTGVGEDDDDEEEEEEEDEDEEDEDEDEEGKDVAGSSWGDGGAGGASGGAPDKEVAMLLSGSVCVDKAMAMIGKVVGFQKGHSKWRLTRCSVSGSGTLGRLVGKKGGCGEKFWKVGRSGRCRMLSVALACSFLLFTRISKFIS